MSMNRRMKNRISRIGVFLMAAVFVMTAVMISPVKTEAEESYSLTLTKSVENLNVSIYEVMSEADGTYTLTDDFAKAKVDLSNLDIATDCADAASELVDYVEDKKVKAIQSGKVGTDKTYTFAGMETGLYLVVSDTITVGENTYSMQPILVYLPLVDDGVIMSDGTVECKIAVYSPETPEEPIKPHTTTKTTKTTPAQTRLLQTGQDWLPVFLLIGGGLIVLVVGLKLKRREK